MIVRTITPELLDELPHDDPAAIHSRRDLRLINRLMGNFAWLEKQIAEISKNRADLRIVEPGAGDGTLARRLIARFPDLRYTAVDLAPPPEDLPEGIEWLQGDLFQVLPELEGDVVIANLFLHHFEDEQLRELSGSLRGFRHVICNEPARRSRFRWLARLLFLSGINHVTRHDMMVSITAGFTDQELPDMLKLNQSPWTADVHESVLGGYRMSASQS